MKKSPQVYLRGRSRSEWESPRPRPRCGCFLGEEFTVLTDDVIGRMHHVVSPLRQRREKTVGLIAVCLAALAWIGNAGAATSVIDPILLADANSSPAQSEQMI